MVSTNYNQKMSLIKNKKQKTLQILSIVLQVLSLGFIVIGIVINFYYYIGFLLMYGLGLLIYQFYTMTAREYEYALTESQIIFIKRDMRLHSKNLLNLNLSEIKEMKQFSDIIKTNELIVTDDVARVDVKEIEYNKNGNVGYVVFSPDEYMLALLEDRLIDMKN